MTSRQKERQLFMVLDLGEGHSRLERLNAPSTRRKSTYSYRERNQSLTDWWDRNNMATLISLEAMNFMQKKSVQIAELSGQSVEFSSHISSEDDSATELLRAFLDSNFEPITILEMARKLRTERIRMEGDLQGRGHWIGEFFDYIVDNIIAGEQRSAKPNLTEEYKSKIKAYIRGQSLTSY